MPRVAVIIVTYNSARFLPELFVSLKAMQHPAGGVQFIFVDNASADHSPELVREAMPDAALVREKENRGFSAGVNAGLRHPLAQGVEFIALLNPDTVVHPDWLTALVNALEGQRKAVSAQSLILYAQDREKVNSAGNSIHFLGFGFSQANGQSRSVILNEVPIPSGRNEESPTNVGSHTREILRPDALGTQDDVKLSTHFITYASGAAVLYRHNALKEIGLFDENLFMYHDDLDVGWKFLLRGYQNILVPSSIVYHHYEFSRSIRKYYWIERNRLLLLLTHYKFSTLLLILPALIILEFGLMFFALYRGFFGARLRAYVWIFVHVPLIMKKHKYVQNIRTQPDKAVLGSFTGVITDQEISNPLVEYVMNPVFALYLAFLRYVIRW
ncbi:MAG: glycosyltransferase family 2 protein [Patescibacteria group bacterium]